VWWLNESFLTFRNTILPLKGEGNTIFRNIGKLSFNHAASQFMEQKQASELIEIEGKYMDWVHLDQNV
jgi:hypothetical protein